MIRLFSIPNHILIKSNLFKKITMKSGYRDRNTQESTQNCHQGGRARRSSQGRTTLTVPGRESHKTDERVNAEKYESRGPEIRCPARGIDDRSEDKTLRRQNSNIIEKRYEENYVPLAQRNSQQRISTNSGTSGHEEGRRRATDNGVGHEERRRRTTNDGVDDRGRRSGEDLKRAATTVEIRRSTKGDGKGCSKGVSATKMLNSNKGRKYMMLNPVPKGIITRLVLTRTQNTSHSNVLVKTSTGETLAVCSKKPYNPMAYYTVSCDPNAVSPPDKNSPDFVGKIRVGLTKQTVVGYGAGENPLNLKKQVGCADLASLAREELCHVQFETGKNARMRVIVPHVISKNGAINRVVCKPLAPAADGLGALAPHFSQLTTTAEKTQLVQCFVNKMPKVEGDIATVEYMFHGQNSVLPKASRKNFVLVNEADANKVALQFIRCQGSGADAKSDFFLLDVYYPFSPFQALTAAMSTM